MVATRWYLAVFVADKDTSGSQASLFMIQLSTPSIYGSTVVNWGAYYGHGGLQVLCKDGTITPFEPALDPASGYYIPHEILFEWRGVDGKGNSFAAECRTKPTTLCDRVNLLDLLPFVMRKIVETFVTKPFVYQWVDRATVSIQREEPTETLNGWMAAELTLLGED